MLNTPARMSATSFFPPPVRAQAYAVQTMVRAAACALCWLLAFLPAGACEPEVAEELPETVRVLGLAEDGALLLADGRRFRPQGIALPSRLDPDPDLIRASQGAIAAVLAHDALRLAQGGIDRYGHLMGQATLADGGDASLALLRAGAGHAQSAQPRRGRQASRNGARDARCNALYLAAEEHARQAGAGIWATSGARTRATDELALAARAGLFTVVEGTVTGTGSTREWIYLNFGPRWSEDFTILVAPRDFVTIFGDGLDPAMLQGTVVRARGVLREKGGPAIFARAPEDVTWLGLGNEEQNRR